MCSILCLDSSLSYHLKDLCFLLPIIWKLGLETNWIKINCGRLLDLTMCFCLEVARCAFLESGAEGAFFPLIIFCGSHPTPLHSVWHCFEAVVVPWDPSYAATSEFSCLTSVFLNLFHTPLTAAKFNGLWISPDQGNMSSLACFLEPPLPSLVHTSVPMAPSLGCPSLAAS